jgi:hypothetical protein
MSTLVLEDELVERKTRLAEAQADVQRPFLSHADDHACIAVLERALAKAYRFF